jgi:hypothetical protein
MTERLLRKYVTFCRPQPALPSVGEFLASPDGHPLTSTAMKMTSSVPPSAPASSASTRIRCFTRLAPTPKTKRHAETTLQHCTGHSSSKVTERYAHAAQREKLKRARGFSPIDQLGLRVKPVRQTTRRTK